MTLPNELHPGFFSAGGGADLGDTIEQSLRFSGGTLSRTFGTPTDQNKWTYSCWFKRGNITSAQTLGLSTQAASYGEEASAEFNSTGDLLCFGSSNGSSWTTFLQTDQVFRDPSAWYHLLTVLDLDQADSNNRWKWYVNGTQIASFSSNTRSAQGTNHYTNSAQAHTIGSRVSGGSKFDGYMAQVIFLDGQALDPTYFGRTNDDGVWVPVNYTGGNYGSNGFHLTFDSTQANGVGHDSSGNGNDWTVSSFNTTALSTSNIQNDIDVEDTPTSNYATGNPLRTIGTIRYGNMEFQNDSGVYTKTDGTLSFPTSGVWQYEYHYIESQLHVGYKDPSVESPNTSTPPTQEVGHWFIVNNKNYFENGAAAVSIGGANITAGQIITFIFDADNEQAKWYIDGTLRWTDDTPNRTTYPHLVPFMGTYDGANEWNFGQWPFRYTPVSDAKALSVANMPEPTIKDGSAHFQTLIGGGAGTFKYASESTTKTTEAIDFSELDQFTPTSTDVTGRSFILDTLEAVTSVSFTITNGWGWSGQTATIRVSATGAANSWTTTTSTQTMENNETVTVSNGSAFRYIRVYRNATGTVNFGVITTTNQALLSRAQSTFANGLYWIKDRQNSNQHQLVDTVRGVSLASQCPGSSKNQSYAAPSGNSVAWCWKSDSPAVNGFNIVEYTGNASSTQAIAHGLPSTPEWIITASQGASPGGFETYHVACSSGQSVTIDAPRAQASSSRYSGVDATNITYGGDYNTDGQSMIFYAWTSVEGYSKFGSYESNVQDDGPYVYLGFKPSLVILKSVDESTSVSWKFADIVREPENLTTGIRLAAVSQDAETVHSNEAIDFLSNGFKIRGTSNSQNAPNINQTFLYCAFAESPFGGENVPPATAR